MEKLRARITFCDPATRRLEGIIKGNAIVQIAVWELPIAFRWPQENEMWTIHYSNGFWHLGQKVDYEGEEDVTTGIESLNPGDTRVSTGGSIVLDGDVHVNGSLLENGQLVNDYLKWKFNWIKEFDYTKNDVVVISSGQNHKYFVAIQDNFNSSPLEDEDGEYWSQILEIDDAIGTGGGSGGGHVYWIGSGSGYEYSSLSGITSPSTGDIAIDNTNKKNYAFSNIAGWRELVKPALATSDVTGLDTALSGKSATSHTHAYGSSSLTGFGTAAAKDVPVTSVATQVNASSSQVVMGDDTRLSDSRDPKTHNHSTSETWLSNALATKADASSLSGYATTTHTHSTSETWLSNVLSTKANSSHVHSNTDISNWDTALAAKGYATLASTQTFSGVNTFSGGSIFTGSVKIGSSNAISYSGSAYTYETAIIAAFGSGAATPVGSLYLQSDATAAPLFVKRSDGWRDVSYSDHTHTFAYGSANLTGFGTAAAKTAASTGVNATSTQVVIGDDTRLTNARVNSTWMTVSEKSGLITGNNAYKYILGMGVATFSSSSSTTTGYPIYIDPADYSVSGRTTEFRLRIIAQVNNVTTIKTTFEVGLMSMSNDDGLANAFNDAGNLAKTYPSVSSNTGSVGTGIVTNSNCSPSADIAPQTSTSLPGYGTFVSSTFSVSSANRYAIYVYSQTTGTTGMVLTTGTGNTLAAEVMAFLQVRYT